MFAVAVAHVFLLLVLLYGFGIPFTRLRAARVLNFIITTLYDACLYFVRTVMIMFCLLVTKNLMS